MSKKDASNRWFLSHIRYKTSDWSYIRSEVDPLVNKHRRLALIRLSHKDDVVVKVSYIDNEGKLIDYPQQEVKKLSLEDAKAWCEEMLRMEGAI